MQVILHSANISTSSMKISTTISAMISTSNSTTWTISTMISTMIFPAPGPHIKTSKWADLQTI